MNFFLSIQDSFTSSTSTKKYQQYQKRQTVSCLTSIFLHAAPKILPIYVQQNTLTWLKAIRLAAISGRFDEESIMVTPYVEIERGRSEQTCNTIYFPYSELRQKDKVAKYIRTQSRYVLKPIYRSFYYNLPGQRLSSMYGWMMQRGYPSSNLSLYPIEAIQHQANTVQSIRNKQVSFQIDQSTVCAT